MELFILHHRLRTLHYCGGTECTHHGIMPNELLLCFVLLPGCCQPFQNVTAVGGKLPRSQGTTAPPASCLLMLIPQGVDCARCVQRLHKPLHSAMTMRDYADSRQIMQIMQTIQTMLLKYSALPFLPQPLRTLVTTVDNWNDEAVFLDMNLDLTVLPLLNGESNTLETSDTPSRTFSVDADCPTLSCHQTVCEMHYCGRTWQPSAR